MIFSKQYELAIRKAINDKRFDIYNAQHQGLLAPGSLSKCLVPPLRNDNSLPKRAVQLSDKHDLSLRNPYVVLPERDLFRGYDKIDPKVLDQKVLEVAKNCKPIVKYFMDREVLEGFVLDDSQVKVDLKYHPKFRMDPKPQKKHSDIVSYIHFIDMLKSIDSPDIDRFV
ncbi:MAG: hypothetical protein V1645_03240 [archaeon]